MFGPIFKRRTPIALEPPSGAPPPNPKQIHSSHALPRLARRLRGADRPRVLDLGSVVGSNLQFFIDLGCKVSADDLLRPVETVIPDNGHGSSLDWKAALQRRLEYPDHTFDAIIAWDLFDFMAATEARAFSRDLYRVSKPGGIVMAYFTSREAERRAAARRFRILDDSRIEWINFGSARSLRHVYQNRDIEKMFEGFKTYNAVVLQNGTREMLLEKKAPATVSLAAPAAR